MEGIFFILIAIPVAFTLIKASGLSANEITVNTANVEDKIINIPTDTNSQLNQNIPEIVSQNPVSTSSGQTSNQCQPDIGAQIVVIRYLNNPYAVYEMNSDSRWPIASITKLMTAVIALENVDQNKKITLTADIISKQDNYSELKKGGIYTVKDLIKAMMMISSNNAADAIARDFGEENFIALMNQKARGLSMFNTQYFDPTGLTVNNQSTPNDLIKLITYIYNNYPDLLKMTRTRKDYVTDLNSDRRITLTNIDDFAGQVGFIGGKTGYIDQSQGNLISLFKESNGPVVFVVMGSQNRFGDTQKLLNCLK